MYIVPLTSTLETIIVLVFFFVSFFKYTSGRVKFVWGPYGVSTVTPRKTWFDLRINFILLANG